MDQHPQSCSSLEAWLMVEQVMGYANMTGLGALAIIQAAGGTINDFLANDGLWKGNRLIAGPAALYPALSLLFTK